MFLKTHEYKPVFGLNVQVLVSFSNQSLLSGEIGERTLLACGHLWRPATKYGGVDTREAQEGYSHQAGQQEGHAKSAQCRGNVALLNPLTDSCDSNDRQEPAEATTKTEGN